jgi:hypothetical protein
LTIEPLGLMIAGIGGGTQTPFYHVMAANNTYGFNVSNDTTYASYVAALPKPHDSSIGLEQHLDPHLGQNTLSV